MVCTRTCLSLVCSLLLASALCAGDLEIALGEKGVESLAWGKDELLVEGAPKVEYVILEKQTPGEMKEKGALVKAGPITGYEFEKVSGENPQVAYDADKKELTCTYPFGTVRFAYEVGVDRLTVTTILTNTSERIWANFKIEPLKLMLPEKVEKPKHWRRMTDMPDHFPLVEAKFGARKILFCCETIQPLRFGLQKPSDGDKGLTTLLAGGRHILARGGTVYAHHGLPRIAPGKSLTLKWSLRFADRDAGLLDTTPDVVAAFRAYHQPVMVWPDRRPVGAVFLPTSKGPKNNPRNWFKKKDLDVFSAAGKAELRKLTMEFADRCVQQLKATNAQGAVIWNPEGGEHPHPITYIGDPRMVEVLAPEMVDIYPDFFKKFTDAGFRVGCCLRPTQVYEKEPGKWAHGTGSHGPERNPLNDNYDEVWPEGVGWWRFFPVAERISRKIDWARENWGCTLFYIDTNGVHRQIGEKQEFKWTLLDTHIWREIHIKQPDVLLIPEFSKCPGQYAFTSSYLQPPHSSTITNGFWRRIVPTAFSVSYTVNLNNEQWAKKRDTIKKGIEAGDSMFFRGWFGDHYNKKIKEVYDEVYEPGAINPGLDLEPQPEVTDEDLATVAAVAAGQGGAPTVAAVQPSAGTGTPTQSTPPAATGAPAALGMTGRADPAGDLDVDDAPAPEEEESGVFVFVVVALVAVLGGAAAFFIYKSRSAPPARSRRAPREDRRGATAGTKKRTRRKRG